MALLFADGFDHYGTDASVYDNHFSKHMAGKWDDEDAVYKMRVAPGYLGGYCLHQDSINTTGVYVRKFLPAHNGSLIVGMRFRENSASWNAFKTLFILRDALGNEMLRLRRTPVGTVQIGTGDPFVPSLESDRHISTTAWNYIECKMASTGTAIRFNGAPAGSGPGGPVSAARIFDLRGGGPWTYYDDLYICDTSGTQNNDFLGDVRILTLRPNRDVSTQFTRSNPAAAGNYAMVNDAPGPDEDATYNRTAAAGKRDLFGLAASGLDPALYGVKGVQVVVRGRKEDSGTRYLAGVLRSGGPESNAAPKALATAMQYQQHVAEINPATGLPWTLAEVEAAAIGYDTSAP